MCSWTRKSYSSPQEYFQGHHRFEHWYRDNQVYFITARCWDAFPAFAAQRAKEIFWDRFDYYTQRAAFTPWVTSLLSNHYHTLGYNKLADNLGEMMRKIHGSVAKLVNDLLSPRHVPFWGDPGHQDYFDGCIRDETQCRRAYRYTLTQSERHRICGDWRKYPETHVNIDVDVGVRRALDLHAFLEGVPYKRYQRRKEA